jgi:hypothetical protein
LEVAIGFDDQTVIVALKVDIEVVETGVGSNQDLVVFAMHDQGAVVKGAAVEVDFIADSFVDIAIDAYEAVIVNLLSNYSGLKEKVDFWPCAER